MKVRLASRCGEWIVCYLQSVVFQCVCSTAVCFLLGEAEEQTVLLEKSSSNCGRQGALFCFLEIFTLGRRKFSDYVSMVEQIVLNFLSLCWACENLTPRGVNEHQDFV